LKTGLAAAGVALLLNAAAAPAQVYKWVDAKGVTHYSDTPPAGRATDVLAPPAPAAPAVALPYELSRAVRAAPVTLYTIKQCTACDQGRALLKSRGIPFTEKTVTTAADQEALRAAGGGAELPLLRVGRATLAGFQQDEWNAALTRADYPARSMLPARYRHPQPVAAAPSPPAITIPAAESAAPHVPEAARARPKPETPPGFKF
jgi:glutaredoxin